MTWSLYMKCARLLVLGILPFMIICIINTKIYIAIRRRRRRRRREDKKAKVLMIMAFVFMVCNLPRVIINLHEITLIQHVNR